VVATPDGRLPPGPRGNLLLGSIPEIRRDNVLAFLDAWGRFGDTVRFRGPLTLYLLAHPDAVKQVLQDNAANYPRPPFVRDRLQAIVGGGLVGAEGAGWVRSRRMAQPAFRRHHLDGYGPLFAEATTEVLDAWAANADTGRPAWPSSPSPAAPAAASARASPCSSSPWWWRWSPSATGSACSRPARPRSRRPSPSAPAPPC
jgi:cytochrome P450